MIARALPGLFLRPSLAATLALIAAATGGIAFVE